MWRPIIDLWVSSSMALLTYFLRQDFFLNLKLTYSAWVTVLWAPGSICLYTLPSELWLQMCNHEHSILHEHSKCCTHWAVSTVQFSLASNCFPQTCFLLSTHVAVPFSICVTRFCKYCTVRNSLPVPQYLQCLLSKTIIPVASSVVVREYFCPL